MPTVWMSMLVLPLHSAFRRVAVAVSVVLVVTLIQPVESAVAAEEVASIPDGALVPAPPATGAERETFAVEGDFSDPMAPVVNVIDALRIPIEVRSPEEADLDLSSLVLSSDDLVSQDEFTNTYVVDGVHIADLSAVPINVQGDDGLWSPVSTSVVLVDDQWGIEDHPLQPMFADEADDAGLFSVTRDGSTVSFRLLGADSSPFSRNVYPRSRAPIDEVTYSDVFEGVDLEYKVGAANVKETLVLDSVPESSTPHWSWDVDTDGLVMVAGDLNDILLQDAGGVTKFRIPQPIMWDSSETSEREAASQALGVTFFEQSSGLWRFTVTADAGWLADAERVYPVFVDPSMTYNYVDTTVSAFKSDGLILTDDVRIGNTREGNLNRYWRSQVLYNYWGIRSYQLLSADIYLQKWDGTANVYSGSISAASSLSYGGTGTAVSTFSRACQVVCVSGLRLDHF